MSESKVEQLDRVRSIVRRCESISKEDASLLEAEIVRLEKDLDRAIEIARRRGKEASDLYGKSQETDREDKELDDMKGGGE